MIKLNTKIGRYALQIEFKEMKQLHKFGSVYGNLPQKCTACGSDNIFLSYKNPKGNDYYMLECGQCKATANFGIHNNDAKNLYWKGEQMTVYQNNQPSPSSENQKQIGKSQNNNPPEDNFSIPDDNEVVPF